MPVYQVPQFIDSGEKIIGPLNLRQFIYALIGGGLTFGIYYLMSAVWLLNIVVSIIAAAPFAVIFGFLAFGKYNGRNAEVYLFKFFEYLRKTKQVAYHKIPETPELDARLKTLRYGFMSSEMDRKYERSLFMKGAKFRFDGIDEDAKLQRIRALSQLVDDNIQTDLKHIDNVSRRNQELQESFDNPEKKDNLTDLYKMVLPQVKRREKKVKVESV